jgi:predicted MFS family arabinose efflux permease
MDGMAGRRLEMPETVETRASWVIAVASLLLISIGFGSTYVVIVALKPIAAELGSRSVPSLASALAYVGTGAGGILMGAWADRVGPLWPALFGSAMVGAGAVVAGSGGEWTLYLGQGLMIGLLGNAGIFAPVLANVSRWFDRRRGAALALVASGQQVAGTIWPPIFRWAVDMAGWRATLFWYGVLAAATMVPLCLFLRHSPPPPPPALSAAEPRRGESVLGLHPNLVQAIICIAFVLCCIAMAMPMGHLVAFCSDLGYLPARGAEMLSLLLGAAFIGRFYWGRLSDRIGGLETVLVGSAAQALALSLYLAIDGLVGLYLVSVAFGLAFGGITPSYLLAVRQLFPASQAGWRIATSILFGLSGMALGGWLAGWIFDAAASYQPAFLAGVAANLANLAFVGFLVSRRRRPSAPLRLAPA